VWGWHSETTKTTTTKKRNGSTVSKRTKTSTIQVTDWEYFIDLTSYIKPVGYVQAELDGESAALSECVDDYAESPKASKRLAMTKYIGDWDAEELEARITEHLKTTQGHVYQGKFTVKFELLQDQAMYVEEGMCEECLMSNSCR
jgi:hypothetical protein